jgi:hypothetical protein
VTGPAIYYFGIVDFLQDWSTRKKIERAFKIYMTRKDPDGLSVMNPQPYKMRFQGKMDQIFDVDNSGFGTGSGASLDPLGPAFSWKSSQKNRGILNSMSLDMSDIEENNDKNDKIIGNNELNTNISESEITDFENNDYENIDIENTNIDIINTNIDSKNTNIDIMTVNPLISYGCDDDENQENDDDDLV